MGKPLIKMDELRVPHIIENLPGTIAGFLAGQGFFFCRNISVFFYILQEYSVHQLDLAAGSTQMTQPSIVSGISFPAHSQ